MKQSGSVSNKILAAVLLATIGLMGAWGFVEFAGQNKHQLEQLQHNAELIANRLTNSLIYPVWNLDDEEIAKALSYEMQTPEVQALILTRENGTFHSGISRSDNGTIARLSAADGTSPPYPASFLTIRKPITKHHETIGSISLHITDQILKKSQRHIAYQILLKILVMSAVISSVIFFSLRRLIIRPLSSLEKSVSGLSPDNLSIELQAKGNDEIATLARSFISMAQELNYNFRKQERLLRELRERDERFSSIVANVPGAIYRFRPDSEHSIVYISENVRDITGYDSHAFVLEAERNLRNMIVDSDRALVLDTINRAIEDHKTFDINYRILDAAGRLRWIHETGQAHYTGDGTVQCLDGVLIDTTDIHSKDEQLRQSQKMETVGMLAGGIAHDFNNILTCIFGTTSLIKMRFELGEETTRDVLEEDINTIELAADRASDLVRQLLSLSMKQEMNLVPTDLNQPLRHVSRLCRSGFDRSVEIHFEQPEHAAISFADPLQIEQVILNVCVNACHAMTVMRPSDALWGGSLKVALRPFVADRFFCLEQADAEERDYWVISVEDTGVGMSAEIQAQIFTPFFSTKEQGMGTGLGLAMVHNIVKQHGGFIQVLSEPGLGTTFNLYFPAVSQDLCSPRAGAPLTLPQGMGYILIADDEDIIRNNAAKILKECGYSVLKAENGEAALELFSSHADHLDLILLDMVMPKLSGKEVFRRIRQQSPELPVLLSSGFKQDGRVQELLDTPQVYFIQKPYTLLQLAGRVTEIINSAKAGPQADTTRTPAETYGETAP